MSDLRIAVIGAGIIGRFHIETVDQVERLKLTAVVDPAEAGRAVGMDRGVAVFEHPQAMIDAGVADAVVVAASNEAHLPVGRLCLEAGLPVLMEKPLANTVEEGEALLASVTATGVPMLVGHHRRHNPIIQAAKAAIAAGEIGDLVTATVMSVLTKPDPYFAGWRVVPGKGGPLLINASHEIDLLRHFFGEIAQVSAVVSSAQRGNPVEDTAAAILTFVGGGVATLTQTDAACGPWAWDVTSDESRGRFPPNDAIAHAYAGTKAALSLPDLTLWKHPGVPDWTTKMERRVLSKGDWDCYERQLQHFGQVARGQADPAVSAGDALQTMRVIGAIREAAETRRAVSLSS